MEKIAMFVGYATMIIGGVALLAALAWGAVEVCWKLARATGTTARFWRWYGDNYKAAQVLATKD